MNGHLFGAGDPAASAARKELRAAAKAAAQAARTAEDPDT